MRGILQLHSKRSDPQTSNTPGKDLPVTQSGVISGENISTPDLHSRSYGDTPPTPKGFRQRSPHSPPRFVTQEDITALAAARSGGAAGETAEAGPLDYICDRVVVIDTKVKRIPHRKRSLSVSPRLGSRSEASSDGSLQRISPGAGLYSWVQCSLRRRRLRKKLKKSLGQNQGKNVGLPPSASEPGETTVTRPAHLSPPIPDSPLTLRTERTTGTTASHQVSTPEVCGSPSRVESSTSGVTYVNHRNGHVTAVTASSILKALSPKHKQSDHFDCEYQGEFSSSGCYSNTERTTAGRRSCGRPRSISASRRVVLSTTSQGKSGKKRKKRHRVLGGAWGLFHCAGAGARSRSCTPERNINFRVRSRSATPERLINVRINSGGAVTYAVPLGKSGGKKQTTKKKMKGRSKSKSKTSGRRVSVSSEDDKENNYDMWGFIKGRILEGRKPCASERLSRRDTLPCRPRGSVNINRDIGEMDFSPLDIQPFPNPDHLSMKRSQSERRYNHKTAPIPVDTQTIIYRAPPTDLNFNHCGSVPTAYVKNGEIYRQPKHATSQTSVTSSSASSTSDYGSCKDSVISIPNSSRGAGAPGSQPPLQCRSNTLPARYRNRPLPPIPKPDPLPPKPPESGVQLVKTIKLDKIMKNKWISGVAVTRKCELVVVDLREAYLLDAEGNLKRTIGSCSSRNSGSLKEPIDVAVMANGNLLFSDHSDQEVKIYSTKGHLIRKVMDKCLANIAGVASSDKKIFIAGTDKRCITVHSEDDGLLYSIPNKDVTHKDLSFTSKDTGKAIFEHPYSIAVNPLTGDLIVGDDYKQRVIAISQDGRVLWRYSPTGDRHFFPCSIAVDNEGYIFIADLYNEKVYMLDSSGKPLKVLLSRGEGLKGGPGALAVDGRGHLIVADEERSLKVFKYGDKGFTMYRRISMCPDYR